jgi:hypothetical protein
MSDARNDEEASSADVSRGLAELNLALGRYMIALGGAFQPTYYDGVPSGKPEYFCFPGFLLAVRNAWLFVTAGHNLRAILHAYGDKQNQWTGMAWSHFIPDPAGAPTRPLDNTVQRPLYFGCELGCHSIPNPSRRMIFEEYRDAISAGLLITLALSGLAVIAAGPPLSVTLWVAGALFGAAGGTALAALSSGRPARDAEDECPLEEPPAFIRHDEAPVLPTLDEHPVAGFTARVEAERTREVVPDGRSR